jgi:hypothetical protein
MQYLLVKGRDVIRSDTDGYYSFHNCFHFFLQDIIELCQIRFEILNRY